MVDSGADVATADGSGLEAELVVEGWELGTELVPSEEIACVVGAADVSVTGVASPESPLPPQAAAKIAREARATASSPGFFAPVITPDYYTWLLALGAQSFQYRVFVYWAEADINEDLSVGI